MGYYHEKSTCQKLSLLALALLLSSLLLKTIYSINSMIFLLYVVPETLVVVLVSSLVPWEPAWLQAWDPLAST